MASVLDGQWEITEVDAGNTTSSHHLSYLPSQNDKIQATYLTSPEALRLVTTVEGVTKTKLYLPLTFAATTLYFLVEDLSATLSLLDVVMIDFDHVAGKMVMQHDYYWSDQTHWTVNNENSLIKVGMTPLDVIKCVVARYKLAGPGAPVADKNIAPLWRCINSV